MGDDDLKTTGVSSTNPYDSRSEIDDFSISLPNQSYNPPSDFAVFLDDGTLDLVATEEKLQTFITDLQSQLDTTNVMTLEKVFFPSLGITAANWKDFCRLFPELKFTVEEAAFQIATLLLEHRGENDGRAELIAVRFLASMINYKGHGINRGSLIYAHNLSECKYGRLSFETSKGKALYDKLIASLEYALNPPEYAQSKAGHGGCFAIEASTSVIQAAAGADRVIHEDKEIELSGSDSYTSSGMIQSYVWEQVDGPEVAWLSDPNSVRASFKTPIVFQNQVLKFKLTIMDSTGVPYTDTVTYELENNINEAPEIEIDGPTEVNAGERVRLSAVASDDNPDDSLSYSWEEVTEYGINIRPRDSDDPNQSKISFTAPLLRNKPGYVKVRVTVNDGHTPENNGQDFAELIIKVLPMPTPAVAEVPPKPKPEPAEVEVEAVAELEIPPIIDEPCNYVTMVPNENCIEPEPLPDGQAGVPIKRVAIKPQPKPKPEPKLPELPPIPDTPTYIDEIVQDLSNEDPVIINNRIVVLFDVSGSMMRIAQSFGSNVDSLIDQILENMPEEGFLEIALGDYHDGQTHMVMPFHRAYKSKPDEIAELKESLKDKTQEIADTMHGGGIESLWHSIYDITDGEQRLEWENQPETTAQIIYALTDYELYDRVNVIDKWDSDTAEQLAQSKGIGLNPLELSERTTYNPRQIIETLAEAGAELEQKRRAAKTLASLESIGLKDHIIALLEYPGNDDEVVKTYLLDGLARLKSEKAKDVFKEVLTDKDSTTMMQSIALSALMDLSSTDEINEIVLEILDDPDNAYHTSTRSLAAKYFRIHKYPQGFPVYAKVLENNTEAVSLRVQMVGLFKDIGTEQAASQLIKQLDSPHYDSMLYTASTKALVSLPFSEEIAARLVEVLRDEDGKHSLGVRLAVASYFQKYRYEDGVGTYVAVLDNKDEEPILRYKMVDLLAKIESSETIASLTDEMNDRLNPIKLRRHCAAAFRELAETSQMAEVYMAILSADHMIFDTETKLSFAQHLDNVPVPFGLDIFEEIATDRTADMYLRSEMIEMLKRRGGPGDISTLIAEMNDGGNSMNIRRKSAIALGDFNQPGVVAELVFTFGKKGEDPSLRGDAGVSLARLESDDAIEPALQILKENEDEEILPAAIKIVAHLDDPKVRRLIKRSLRKHRDDEQIRMAALEALAGPREEV